MHRILLVEDSPQDQILAQEALGNAYMILTASSAEEAVEMLTRETPDLILLDLSLPKKDGYSLLTLLQSHPGRGDIPVICLSGRGEIADKVAAFSLGVDDYLVKPYHLVELKARVDSKIRRFKTADRQSAVISHGPIVIDRDQHRVFVTEGQDRREVVLTPTEFKLLQHLARSPNRVFTREQLMQAGWGSDAAVFDRAVDVHVCGIRRKLHPYSDLIRSVPGIGYKLTSAPTARADAAPSR